MSKHTIAKFCTLCCLLAPMIAFGQSMISSGSSTWGNPTGISNFPDIIVTGGNFNAWHLMPGNASQVFSNQGKVAVVNSSCQAFTYNEYPTNSWTQQTAWGCVYGVYFGGDGNTYSLFGTNCGGAGATSHYVGKWNGSAWANTGPGCGTQLSFDAQTGTVMYLIGMGSLPAVWESTNYGASWTQQAGCAGSGGALSVSGIDTDGNVNLICGNDSIWYGNDANSGSYSSLPGVAVQVVNTLVSVYVRNASNQVFVWDGNTKNWDQIATPEQISYIAASNSLNVWGIGASTKVYRISENGMDVSLTYSGSVQCNVPIPPAPQGYCNQFTHTATAQLKTNKKTGAVAQQNWNGPGGWGVTAHVHVNDIFDCFDPSEDCYVGVAGGNPPAMHCSGGGTSSGPPPPPAWNIEHAVSRMETVNNVPTCGPNVTAEWSDCAYQVGPYCGNTTHPDLNPVIVDSLSFPPNIPYAMDVSSTCFSLNHSPFWCPGNPVTTSDHDYPKDPNVMPRCTVGIP